MAGSVTVIGFRNINNSVNPNSATVNKPVNTAALSIFKNRSIYVINKRFHDINKICCHISHFVEYEFPQHFSIGCFLYPCPGLKN